MRLKAPDNLELLPSLSPNHELAATLRALAGVAVGTVKACLIAAAYMMLLPPDAGAQRPLQVFLETDRFKFESASVAEGEIQTIRITKKVQGIVTLHYWNEAILLNRRCCDSATIGVDVPDITRQNPKEVSFQTAANVQRTITVQSKEGTAVELDEEYWLKFKELIAVGGERLEYQLKIKILNDDKAELVVSSPWRPEGEDLVFQIKLWQALPRSVTVTPQITYGTATAEDITANPQALTFAGTEGETKTFTVKTVDDSLAEGRHEFTVNLAVTQPRKPWAWIDENGNRNLSPFNIRPGTGTIEDNEMSLSVPENSPGGTFIGGPGENLLAVYSLSGFDDLFTISSIVPDNGRISVAQGANLDYETTSSYTGTIDQGPLAPNQDITLTIDITDVDEPPGKPGPPAVTQSLTSSVSELDVTWTAPANTGPAISDYDVQYRKQGESDWNSHSFTGTGTTTTITGLESGATYEVQVRATNDEGTSPWSDSGTGSTSGPPEITNPGDKTYQQGQTITSFGITVTDEDPESLTVTVTGLPSGLSYTNDEVQGTVSAEATMQDYTVTIRAVDQDNLSATATFTITVIAPNDPPVITNPGDKTYQLGETITPFRIVFNDPDGDHVTVGAKGLPPGVRSVPDLNFDPEIHSSPWLMTGTVSADATVQAYTVTLWADDGVNAEVTETFTITVTEPVPVTIEDASANEGDSITFTVTLKEAVSGGLTVTPSFTDGTATEGTDYSENTAALTFAGTAGESKTFTVATTEDMIEEPDETFTVSLAVSGTTATVTATGTIIDDDAPALTVGDTSGGTADVSASEGDPMTFTVRLDKAVPGGLTVTPSFTDGTATEGTDYTENTAALTFAGTAGETQTFSVATTEDTNQEPDETFTVRLTVSNTTATVTATDTAQGTILDDDAPVLTVGDVSAGSADVSASEGDSMTFTVRLDKAVPGGLTVTPSFADGTATEGTDYTENTTALAFAGTAGETQTFTVPTTEDTDQEPDETFTVSLTVSNTTATVTATDTAQGTILDDDAPALTVGDASAGSADVSASEGDSMTFTVRLDKAVSGGFTVTPSFTDGTATKGTDYTENTAALSFAGTAGETQTFTVPTTEDTDQEPDETFTVSLAVSNTTATVTASDTAKGTILDDDAPALTIGDASAGSADVSASEGDSMTFTVRLDREVPGGLTVTPSFTDGTATKGTDYTENTAALNFAGTAGETKTFTVATTEDTDAEPDETFTVSLAVSGTTATVTASDTAKGTILDDDAPALTIGDASAGSADVSASEGDSMTFTVRLDREVPGGLTVTPSFTDGTATKGTDYTENTAALNFAGTAGETKTFTVATTEDTDAEPDETFTVSLAVSGTTATVTASDTAKGTILDDDASALTIGDASAGSADVSASEGDSMIFTVRLDREVPGGLTVTPSFTDGTATKGTDYTENTAALTFAGTAGETKTFTVATTQDTDVEPDETFTVSLAVSGTTATVTASDTAKGTILDDDETAPAVTIADSSASEGDSIMFYVTLDKVVAGRLTVTPSFADGTATKGTDYTENTAPLSFVGNAGETHTFVVATTEDPDDEPNETFVVSLTVSDTTETVTATDTATGTITDDDDPSNEPDADGTNGISLSVDPGSVDEEEGSRTLSIRATLNGPTLPDETEVTVFVKGGTATPKIDYAQLKEFTIRIPAGLKTARKEVRFDPKDDELFEDSETVIFAGYGVLESTTATLTLEDDESDAIGENGLPSITIWTDRLGYSIDEPVRMYRDIDPRGDDREYTVFVYLESIDTGLRRYLAPEVGSMELREELVDHYGAGEEFRRASRLRRVEPELTWEGRVPHAGLWHFVAELRSPGTAQVLKRAYAKFVVPRHGFRSLNRPGTERVLTKDTRLTRDLVYSLGDHLVVQSGVTLTIEAGTLIRAYGPSAGISVEPGGHILVRGRREAPVVMTCSLPVGQRFPGCWGGLAVFGNLSRENKPGSEQGGPPYRGVSAGTYGWKDSTGVLRYLRVEFAGGTANRREEPAALALHDVGSRMVMDHVQVHASAGDGLAFRGGAAHCSHCVASEARLDSVDWSQGWRGSAQYLYVQQGAQAGAGMRGSAGWESGGASPTFHNLTLVGGYNTRLPGGAPGTRRSIGPGILLEGDATITAQNLLAVGFAGFAIDGSATSFAAGDSSVASAIFYVNGARHSGPSEIQTSFEPYIAHLQQDPDLLNIRYEANPDPRPRSGSVALQFGNATVPPFDRRFSRAGHFIGAFRKKNWLEEWTFFGPESDYEVAAD